MVHILKANGTIEEFDEAKLIGSIRRAGIPQSIESEVMAHVKSKLYDHMPSAEVYRHITEFLQSGKYHFFVSRYSLKQAIMDLGPTGYPFEDFIAELLQALGYDTQVRQILPGRCVNHEIDVIAKKDGKTSLIEAKFHNRPGSRSDVRVPMYTKSRFDDVKERHGMDDVWIVTNTKATTDAIAFAECVGMKIISWSYPNGKSLRELIESTGLYPVTALSSLAMSQKIRLLNNHVVLVKSLNHNPELLDTLQLSHAEKEKVKHELKFICELNGGNC